MSNLMTLHKILPGCEEGNPEAWRAFLANYTPLALQFFRQYSPGAPDAAWDHWRDALRVLSAYECSALRGFSHQSEREFLVDLRAFLQEWAAKKVESSPDAADPPAPTRQEISVLLSGLPLLHQEVVYLTLAGYSQGTLENILRITPAVAGAALERLRPRYAPMLERSEDRCLWPSAWGGLCRAARTDGQKDCPSLRQLIRILDGQASWYDKSPAEEHCAKCLHCLGLWTSLREVIAWDRIRQPCPEDQIEALMVDIPKIPDAPQKSLLDRLFGR